jgi:hypothetical protein
MIVTYLFIPRRQRFQVVARTSMKHTTVEQFLTKIGGGLQEAGATDLLDASRCAPRLLLPTRTTLPSKAPRAASLPDCSRRPPSPVPGSNRHPAVACRLSIRHRSGEGVGVACSSSAPTSVLVLWSEHNSGRAILSLIPTRPLGLAWQPIRPGRATALFAIALWYQPINPVVVLL